MRVSPVGWRAFPFSSGAARRIYRSLPNDDRDFDGVRQLAVKDARSNQQELANARGNAEHDAIDGTDTQDICVTADHDRVNVLLSRVGTGIPLHPDVDVDSRSGI